MLKNCVYSQSMRDFYFYNIWSIELDNNWAKQEIKKIEAAWKQRVSSGHKSHLKKICNIANGIPVIIEISPESDPSWKIAW